MKWADLKWAGHSGACGIKSTGNLFKLVYKYLLMYKYLPFYPIFL